MLGMMLHVVFAGVIKLKLSNEQTISIIWVA